MINNETIIYELCNKYQWFTCGSVRQYEKALTMAKGGVPITELARVIWICSDPVIPRTKISRSRSMNNTNTVIDEDDSGKVRYKDLRCGDMFEYGKNSDFYMKTSEGRLHLATGIVEHMDDCILVLPKNALLIRKN